MSLHDPDYCWSNFCKYVFYGYSSWPSYLLLDGARYGDRRRQGRLVVRDRRGGERPTPNNSGL